MNSKKTLWTGLLCILALTVLILDSKTALAGAKDGIALCLYTVIPSLFPFVFLSVLLTPILTGCKLKLLQPIGRLCCIPTGAEPLLLLGFLGGYPIGAQAIASSWKKGKLSTETARRMLGFCSNAGPSFLFGMGAALFFKAVTVWILWAIHIFSAILVGILLPRKKELDDMSTVSEQISVVNALEKSTKAMASICGWVILFRVTLTFLSRWLFWAITDDLSVLITGFMELANGCVDTKVLYLEGQRFIWMSVFLGFGGLCVLAQTVSVTGTLGIGAYLPGKFLQCSISFLLAYYLQFFLFEAQQRFIAPPVCIILAIMGILGNIFFLHHKKVVAFIRKMIYNTKKITT